MKFKKINPKKPLPEGEVIVMDKSKQLFKGKLGEDPESGLLYCFNPKTKDILWEPKRYMYLRDLKKLFYS